MVSQKIGGYVEGLTHAVVGGWVEAGFGVYVARIV